MHRSPLKELAQNGDSQRSLGKMNNEAIVKKAPFLGMTEAFTMLAEQDRSSTPPEGTEGSCGGKNGRSNVAEATTPTGVPKTPLKPSKPAGQ